MDAFPMASYMGGGVVVVVIIAVVSSGLDAVTSLCSKQPLEEQTRRSIYKSASIDRKDSMMPASCDPFDN